MDLELVVLAFITNPSPDDVQIFTAAAAAGHFDKVRRLNGAQLNKARTEQIMQHRGFHLRPHPSVS